MSFVADKKREHETAAEKALTDKDYAKAFFHTAKAAEFGLRLAEERGIDYSGGDVSLLTTEPELALIRKMLQLPEVMELVSQTLEPHHLPYYAKDVATVFHNFYEKCRVVSDDEALTGARLKLVAAARIVLARTLGLMGMTAPESM